MPRRPLLAFLALIACLSAGCDMLGIETPDKLAAVRDAEGKAIGGACRHAGRAIEDCYVLNKKADKAAVFAGWREMNDYMRENKLEAVAPQLPPPGQAQPKAEGETADESAKPPLAKSAAKAKDGKAHES